ncbi:MAG TPA: hypothetical protein VGB73_00775 [Pyrinomonadaceae bacterium]|jgi:hypothetical protein
MELKELAAHHDVKIFDTREAADAEGYAFTETHTTRNVWNRQSAAQATIYKLVGMKRRGEASQIGLVLDTWSVTGCYKKKASNAE